MNIAVLGSVDSGKSSLIGVLTQNISDDGNGSARNSIARHSHEKISGRTSDVGYIKLVQPETGSFLHLIDLAGHEAYLRTTLKGLTNYHPSYALLVVSLTRGITQITREHIYICRYLEIPVIVVLTKHDLCLDVPSSPEKEEEIPSETLRSCLVNTTIPVFLPASATTAKPKRRDETRKEVFDLLRKVQIKFNYDITDEVSCADVLGKFLSNPKVICPIISISNKTQHNIPFLRRLIFSLPPRTAFPSLRKFAAARSMNQVFFVYKPYCIKGIGWIVHGYCAVGSISRNDRLFLGPFPVGNTGKLSTIGNNSSLQRSLNGEYIEIRVRSIHNEIREDVAVLTEGNSGCLAIRPVDGKDVLTHSRLSSGIVCLSQPYQIKQLKADIVVSSARITIKVGTSLYLHSSNMGSLCYVVATDKEPLRFRQTASVILHFPIPQFVFPGARILLRDGSVRAFGIIQEVYLDEKVPLSTLNLGIAPTC